MIFKSKTNEKFAQIPNELAQSEKLSIEAIGLMSYLLSLPEDWVVNKEHLRKHFRMGKDRLGRIMDELMSAGYIKDVPQLRDDGKFKRKNYIVYSKPSIYGQSPPLTRNPSTVNRSLQINKEQKNINKLNKKTEEGIRSTVDTLRLFCEGYGDSTLFKRLSDKEIEVIECSASRISDDSVIDLGQAFKVEGWEEGKAINDYIEDCELRRIFL